MDELEISGKRYISTRRAAKEYKYHADYIGQLIRGKKLLARKVGRSWYVELDSLSQYFGQEAALSEPSQLVAKAVEQKAEESTAAPAVAAEPEARPAAAAAPEPVMIEQEIVVEEEIQKTISEAPVEVAVEEKEIKIHLQKISQPTEERDEDAEEAPLRDSIHIPIRRPSFESPSRNRQPTLRYVSDDAPTLPRAEYASRPSTAEFPPRLEEDAEAAIEEAVITERKSKEHPIWQYVSVAALGGVVLVAVLFASIMVNTHVVKEAGKAASVNYSLQ
jgi:hypothetical protein